MGEIFLRIFFYPQGIHTTKFLLNDEILLCQTSRSISNENSPPSFVIPPLKFISYTMHDYLINSVFIYSKY